jgi:hypothetical protein
LNRTVSGTRSLPITGPATAAPKGFPDEDAAWIDGLAQRLDVANQLARRVAATTDTELAVEAVRGGAGRRHRLGLVGYRRTVKKLIRGPIPYSGARIPCSGKNNSLFHQKNSLFHLLGNIAASI